MFRNKTAKEISVELYKQKLTNIDERNTTASRLTELEKFRFVEATDKKHVFNNKVFHRTIIHVK